MDDLKIKNHIEPVILSQYKHLNGILINLKGATLFEEYYNGFSSNNRFHIASVTKSYISALIGIAINKGYIENVDVKVLDFFPEYRVSPRQIMKKAITIKHLLTMTASYPFSGNRESLERFSRQKDWGIYTLDQLGNGGKIGQFKYASSGAHLLSIILTKATGKSAREFANDYLFKPLGIEELPNYEIKGLDLILCLAKTLKVGLRIHRGIL